VEIAETVLTAATVGIAVASAPGPLATADPDVRTFTEAMPLLPLPVETVIDTGSVMTDTEDATEATEALTGSLSANVETADVGVWVGVVVVTGAETAAADTRIRGLRGTRSRADARLPHRRNERSLLPT